MRTWWSWRKWTSTRECINSSGDAKWPGTPLQPYASFSASQSLFYLTSL